MDEVFSLHNMLMDMRETMEMRAMEEVREAGLNQLEINLNKPT